MKIAIFNVEFYGHIEPTVPMMRELIKHGHDITFVAHNDTKKLNESLGCRVIVFDDQPLFRFVEVKEGSLLFNVTPATLHYLPTLLPIFSQPENKPDLIIYDTIALWGYAVGQILNILCIQCMSGNFVGMVNAKPKEFWLNRKSLEANEKLKEIYKVDLIGSEGHLLYNLPPLILFYTSPAIAPYYDENKQLHKSFVYVGPQIPKREDTDPVFLAKIQEENSKRRVVYVSFGTIVSKGLDFYKMLIDDFSTRSDLFLVVNITRKNKVDDLGKLPSNCIASDWLPQVEMLPFVSVFVTHGGFNSLNEVLALAACPLVTIPFFGDQEANSAFVTEKQIGVALKKTSMDESGRILGAVQKVLDNYGTFKKNAVEIKNSLTIFDTEKIVDLVEHFAKK